MKRTRAPSKPQAVQAACSEPLASEAIRVRKRPQARPALFLLAALLACADAAGQTVPPDIDVTPRTLAFGDQTVGTTSAAREVLIRNVGGSPLSMRSLASSSGDFAASVAGGLPATVAAGGSFKMQVRFTPSIAGNRAGSISISSADPDEPVVVVACSGRGEAWDFGDAPDPAYPTRLASNGARHRLSPLFLGASVDAEADGQPNLATDGDDLEGGPDDEDGVLFMGPLSPGAVGRVTVVASAAGNVNAWIDFNQNGAWEPNEQIVNCRAVVAGPNVLEFLLPGAIPTGSTYARFRLSSVCGLGPDGMAPDGEVEDHRVPIQTGGPLPSTVVFPFSIDGPDSVFFRLFNVNTAGTVRVEVSWEGSSRELAVALTGRRRPDLPDAAVPYVRALGRAPATLSYEVTQEDLRGGVGWRLVISDPARVGEARGTVTLTLPFEPQLEAAMRRARVSLRSGDFWPSASLQDRFLAELAASRGDGLHALISLGRALTCVENEELERLGLIRQSHLAKPGWHSFGLVRKGINLGQPLLRDVLLKITPLEPEDKVDPHILLGNFARFEVVTDDEIPANTVLNPDGTLELAVLFARDVARTVIPVILGAEAVSFDAMSDTHWRVTLTAERLLGLAARDEVEWIGAGPAPPMADNNNTRVAIRSLENAARIDARSVLRGPIPTPDGSNVRVELGNGVAATFGLVTAAGQTALQLRPGPDDIPAANRGTPHAAYDIATTAQFDTVRGLNIQFEYVEGDFPDESLLRVLHFEQGRWIDRTVDLEVGKNLIRARVSDLSRFVIVSGTPSPAPVLRALGFGLADGFALELDGPPGTYEIHRSDNLEAWTLAGTVDQGMAAVKFYDPDADSVRARFYRAVRVR